MNEVFISYAKRTPIGKLAGALSSVRPDDLLAILLKDLKDQISFDPTLIDDVIIGCANQSGEDNRNVARMSLLLADYPLEVPGTTVNRLCGSSLDALTYAWSKIRAGLAECIVVGGVESMSRAPYTISKAVGPFDREQKLYDTSLGWRFPNPEFEKKYSLLTMGQTAEEVAKQLKISREDQDLFAYQSHQKAVSSVELFKEEIVPVKVKQKKSEVVVASDEGPRADTTLEALKKLNPAFEKSGTVTAGNSSSLNDGASLLLVASEQFIKKHKLKSWARITGMGVRGRHPNTMGLGPVDAINKLSSHYNFKISEFDIIELNEAFAAQALGVIRELKINPQIVNPRGGAIALGHPLGSSGSRLVTTLVHQFKQNKNLKQGLTTMCIGIGQGIAVSFESCF